MKKNVLTLCGNFYFMSRFIFILFITFLVACTSNSSNTAENKETNLKNPNGPIMDFISEKIDLGKIIQGESKDCEFRFKNTGKTDLIITGVHAGCGCTSTNWDPKPIKPGQESEIKIKFNSTGKSGVVNKSVTVTSNAQKEEIILHFTCQILSPNKSQ
jgi:hypothetical protein